jgi:hypothetical protein
MLSLCASADARRSASESALMVAVLGALWNGESRVASTPCRPRGLTYEQRHAREQSHSHFIQVDDLDGHILACRFVDSAGRTNDGTRVLRERLWQVARLSTRGSHPGQTA